MICIDHLIFTYILFNYLASYDTVCFSSIYSRGLNTVGVLLPCSSAKSRKSIISLIVVSFINIMCLAKFYRRAKKQRFA